MKFDKKDSEIKKMVNRKTRKIWKQGHSRAIAIPPDWNRGNENIKTVEICYDGAIIIMPEGLSEKRKQKLLEALEQTE